MLRQVPSRISEADGDRLLTAIALVVGIVTSLPVGGTHAHSSWELALALLAWLPLLLRTRWPLPVAVVSGALDGVHIGVAAHHHPAQGMIPAATMLAIYTVAVRFEPRVAWAAAGAIALAQFIVGVATPLAAASVVLFLNWPVVGAILGRLIAERRARIDAADQRATTAEASKEAEAQRQVTAERIRIAHDLHDVLAHHIAVVNAQAGVARFLLRSDPDIAERALAGIANNSRAALDELRVTLGLLRSDGDRADEQLRPTPGSSDMQSLIATFTDAGVRVRTQESGDPRSLSTAADIAVYRIAQEALTNASKHAVGSEAMVDLAWSDESVVLSVVNTASSIIGPGAGTGNGLVGMRERANAAGGTLAVGPTTDGGFRVVAVLPTSASEAGSADGRFS